jgi:glycosyltransferase involved in cell wall biosynthesis
MKILILSNKLPYPPRDGGSIATLNMITGLRDAGNEITCMALNTTKHQFPVEEIPEKLRSTVRFIGIGCDSSIRPVPMLLNLLFSKEPYIAERFNNGEFRRRLTRLLQEEQFDVVQLEGPYPGHYLDVIRAGSTATIACRAHNVEHVIWKRKARNERWFLKRWYLLNMASRLERFEMELVRQVDCLVTISPVDETYFREKGAGQPSITVPTGLSFPSYPLSPLPSRPSVFFIGALDWLPNLEGLKWFLAYVLEPLAARIPEVRFHVAGRHAPEQLRRRLRHSHVVYHGEVEDARAFMQSHRVMVVPLFTGSGIRIKILEAMALGRPVVTTRIGIEGIRAENRREVLVADDPESFKDQIVNLINEEHLAEGLAARGREFIQENFDTFRLSARLSQFFKEQV